MKRVLLFLLVCVLSVQTSWAAIHFCDEAARVGHTPASHQHVNAFPDQDEHAGDWGDALADACCSAAHAYHGLHALITQALPPVAMLSLPSAPAEGPVRIARGRFPERHERPQWSAA